MKNILFNRFFWMIGFANLILGIMPFGYTANIFIGIMFLWVAIITDEELDFLSRLKALNQKVEQALADEEKKDKK